MSRKHEAWRWVAVVGFVALFRPAVAQAQRAEGITVHGNWVIEVRNRDGSVAQRREFENALQVYGQRDLVGFLSRTNPVSFWGVITNGTAGMCLSGADYCQLNE